MSEAVVISPRIVEGLYCEALVLAEEVRAAFTLSGRIEQACNNEDLARVALSCEGLRTTVRMMHAIAWLLNHRAHLMGDISEFQLRRFGRLNLEPPHPDSDTLMHLDRHQRDVVAATTRFYARLLRLDRSWREARAMEPGAIAKIRARMGHLASV